MARLLTILTLVFLSQDIVFGQIQLSGNFESIHSIYVEDSSIGATNTPQYEADHYTSETWATLSANYKKTQLTARGDIFHNSALIDPFTPYSKIELGFIQVEQTIKNTTIQVGHFYTQINNGSTFKAFEDRSLGIDNSILGTHVSSNINDHINIKAFGGKPSHPYTDNTPIIAGGEVLLTHDLMKVHIQHSLGYLYRRLTQKSTQYILDDQFFRAKKDQFNVAKTTNIINYTNELAWKNITGQFNLIHKSKTPYFNRNNAQFEQTRGHLISGEIKYTKAKNSFLLKGRQTKQMDITYDPSDLVLGGNSISFIRNLQSISSSSLANRYIPSPNLFNENSLHLESYTHLTPQTKATLSATNVIAEGHSRYNNLSTTISQYFKQHQLSGIIHHNHYDLSFYEKPGEPNVKSWVYGIHHNYKIIQQKAEWLTTKQDEGDWLHYSITISPHPNLQLYLSDSYNYKPLKRSSAKHFLHFEASYQHKNLFLSLLYKQQEEGINCSNGICRIEPAFSGYSFNLQQHF